MARFPMTFPFYFEEVGPEPVIYPPFRPVSPESLRGFGLLTDGHRAFGAIPAVPLPRLPEDSTDIHIRPFNSSSTGRQFGSIPDDEREFPGSSNPSPRPFNEVSPALRLFDDDTLTGRS